MGHHIQTAKRGIYLSPHLDDAALSCGGQIALQTRAGHPVEVVTLFAGPPQGPLSPFAQSLHRRWGLGEAVAARRREDRAALDHLGAEGTHWDIPECIYRRSPDGAPLYAGEDALWGPLHPADGPLIDVLAQRIAHLPRNVVLYVPLGVGSHVDHQLTRRAAEAAERPLTYYEDYPYADTPEAVAAALGDGTWSYYLIPLDEAALAAKVDAVACYRSQLGTFWADEAEMRERVRAYGARVGGGRPAERYWRRGSSPPPPATAR